MARSMHDANDIAMPRVLGYGSNYRSHYLFFNILWLMFFGGPGSLLKITRVVGFCLARIAFIRMELTCFYIDVIFS